MLTDRQRKHGAAHHVARPVMVQDYPEGGARCLDVERFTRAICMRHVRRLLDPVEQGWKGMAMHWLEQHYGVLRQGYRLLLSACDFLADHGVHIHCQVSVFSLDEIEADVRAQQQNSVKSALRAPE